MSFKLISFGTFVLFLLLLPYIITINDVRCTSQFGKCSPRIEALTDQLVGNSYKEISSKIDSLEELKVDIDKFSYFYLPPSTLSIQLIEKKGEVAFKNINELEYSIVAEDQTIIEKVEKTQLPVVYIENDELLGSNDFDFVIDLMINLSRYYSIREAIWSKNSFTIVYNDSTEIIFPTSGDIDVVLGSMEVILFQLNQALQNSKIEDVDARKISTIDLRYNNPIIK